MKKDCASSPVPDEADEPGETISHGDGALELEPPDESATLESPPDGGLRAWLIVLACTGINALLGILRVLVQVCLLDKVMSSATGVESDTLGEMSEQFIALSDVYAPLAAFVMILFGYRATICIGASVVMTTLIILSYLGDDDTENFIKFLLYGPTAIGMSFIQLGALIPVLEYFTTKRMKALFLSRLGNFVGEFILIVILITPSTQVVVEWRAFLRGCSGLCIGIGLLGLTLKELKLKMKDDELVTFVQRTLGLAKKDILRNVLLWSTCAVYFFYQWGIVTPQGIFADQDTTKQLSSIDNLPKALFYGLSPILGLVLGMFLAWMFKKAVYDEKNRFHVQTLKADRMNIILGILVVAAATMGIGCFIAPHAETFGYFFPFSLVFATFFAFCEGLRDDAVPDEFGRENVRIVEGLILMFAGLGGIITNEIGSNLEDATADENEDDWKKLFRYGGGMLLLSSIVTALVLYLKQSKTLDKIQSKIDANTVVPLKSNVINVISANGKPELKMQSQDRISGVNNQNNTRQRNGNVDSSSKQEHNVTRIHSSRSNKQRNAPPSLNIGYTQSYQQQGVSPTVRSNDTKPYQLPGVPSTVQSEDFKRNQHSKEGLLFNPSGGFKSNQQPGVPSSYQSGGFKSNQQPREPSPDKSGGFKSNQQPGEPSSDQNGGFKGNQHSKEGQMSNPSGGFKSNQQPREPSSDQSGGFKSNQHSKEVPLSNSSGGFKSNQQPREPSPDQSGVFKSNKQPGEPSPDQSGGFKSKQQPGEPSPDQSGGFKSNQQPREPSPDQSGSFNSNQQPREPSSDQSGGFKSNHQPREPSPDQSGGFKSNLQPGEPSSDQSGGFKSNQHPGEPSPDQIGSLKSNQQPGESSSDQSGGFKSNQQPRVPSPDQSGSFKSNQQPREPSPDQNGGFKSNQQPREPSPDQSGGFKSNQQPGEPSPDQSGGVKSNQQPREPSPDQSGSLKSNQQPGEPSSDQSGGFKSNQQSDQSGVFHPYQQRGVLLADHNAVSQPEQRPGLSSLDQIGVFHHNQQRDVPSADQNGVSNPDQRPNVTHH